MKGRWARIPLWLRLFAMGWIMSCATGATNAGPSPPSVPSVLLLNGNTGKPLPGVALFLSPVCDTPCVYPASPLRATSDSSGKIPIPEVPNLRAVQIMMATTDFMYCQDSNEHNIRPINPDRFDWDSIRREGVVSPNRCNLRVHVSAEPGKLIFFLRPLTWWESLSKPPRM